MLYLIYTVHILICLFLILVVLLQQGKGADLSVFGGGGTMTAFGARGAATLLHKMTVFGFVGFIVTTLVIGILQKQGGGSSVMSDVPAPAAATATQDADEAEAEEVVGALPEAEEPTGEVLPEAESFTEGEEPTDGEAASEESTEDPGTEEDATEGTDSDP